MILTPQEQRDAVAQEILSLLGSTYYIEVGRYYHHPQTLGGTSDYSAQVYCSEGDNAGAYKTGQGPSEIEALKNLCVQVKAVEIYLRIVFPVQGNGR